MGISLYFIFYYHLIDWIFPDCKSPTGLAMDDELTSLYFDCFDGEHFWGFPSILYFILTKQTGLLKTNFPDCKSPTGLEMEDEFTSFYQP